MNPRIHVIAEGFVEHPAGELTGETVLMCAECGAIGGHTKRCAIVRFEAATLVGPLELETKEATK